MTRAVWPHCPPHQVHLNNCSAFSQLVVCSLLTYSEMCKFILFRKWGSWLTVCTDTFNRNKLKYNRKSTQIFRVLQVQTNHKPWSEESSWSHKQINKWSEETRTGFWIWWGDRVKGLDPPKGQQMNLRGRQAINGRGKKEKQTSDATICFQLLDFSGFLVKYYWMKLCEKFKSATLKHDEETRPHTDFIEEVRRQKGLTFRSVFKLLTCCLVYRSRCSLCSDCGLHKVTLF